MRGGCVFAVTMLLALPAFEMPPARAADSDWDAGNLVANGRFANAAPGALPEGWQAVCPNPALAPAFQRVDGPDGSPALLAAGNGRRECFGYVRHPVQLGAGKTYRLRVRLRYEGLDDLNLHLVHGVFGSGFNDGIFGYRKEGQWVIGESRFPGPEKATSAEVRLYFRFSATGKVWWDHVSLQECEPIPPRLVRIAVSWGAGDLKRWSAWLDAAGAKKADIALLPEGFNGKPIRDPEPIDGPSASLMAAKARQWMMHVSGSFYERRGDLTLNTAPLFDRQGRLVGSYSKNQLYDPEEDEGVTPGVGLPVLQTDFGRVGIIICYDSWFPETTRLLAYKGADVVLFPNAGYFPGLMPARAADNGVWMAVSSLNCAAGVWDPGGAEAGEKIAARDRSSPSSIRGFEKDDAARLIVATVDLSRQPSPHYWGGPMRSAPGGRRVRQTLMVPIEDEIAREARQWNTAP
jgi:predicted amidohydrolase